MLVCTELVVTWHSWKMRSDMSCNSRSQFTNSGTGRLNTWLHATENYVYLHQSTLKIIWQLLNLFWLFGCCGPSPLTCKKKGIALHVLTLSTWTIPLAVPNVKKRKTIPPPPFGLAFLFIDHSVFSFGEETTTQKPIWSGKIIIFCHWVGIFAAVVD